LKNIYKSIVDEKVKDDQGKYTRHAIGEFKTDEGETRYTYTPDGHVLYVLGEQEMIFDLCKFKQNKSLGNIVPRDPNNLTKLHKTRNLKYNADLKTNLAEFKTDTGESHWVQDKLLKNFDKDATYVLNRQMVIVLEYGKVVGGVMTVKQY
jgi:hypothetical protein